MAKYEYKTVNMISMEYKEKSLSAILNQFGSRGWRLRAILRGEIIFEKEAGDDKKSRDEN